MDHQLKASSGNRSVLWPFVVAALAVLVPLAAILFSARDNGLGSTSELLVLLAGLAGLAAITYAGWSAYSGSARMSADRVDSTISQDDVDRWSVELELQNSMKDEFIANISHEVRTPLNSILGFAGLLQRATIGAKELQFVDRIIESAEDLSSLVKDILEYSILNNEARPSVRDEIDIVEELERVVQAVADRAYNKGLFLDLVVDPSVGSLVRADRIAINKIVSRLIDNGIKFTESGGVVIRIEVISSHGHEDLRITVTDTGFGISDSVKSLMFEGFSQGEPVDTKSHGGLGVGLAVIRKMTDLAGGSIDCQSVEGSGSTFVLTLPCSKLSRLSAKQQVIIHDRDPNAADNQIFVVSNRESNIDSIIGKLNYLSLKGDHISEWSQKIQEGAFLIIHESALAANDIVAIRKTHRLGRVIVLVDSADDESLSKIEVMSGIDLALSSSISSSRLSKCVVSPTLRTKPSMESEEFSIPEIPEIYMQTLRGYRILSVDDNSTNQELMKITLEQLGATVVAAFNGMTAIELCTTQQFDVILMDHQMPKMTGTQCAVRIRNECLLNSNTPIIGLTANIAQGQRDSEFRRAIDDVFVKPIDNHEVVATITACIFRRRSKSDEN